MLTDERLEEIKGHIWAHLSHTDVVLESPRSTLVEALSLCNEVDRLRARDHKYNRMLLSELQKVRHQGNGPDTLYFSDGIQTSVAIIQELEEAGLFVRVGGGPEDHIFGRLTAEGLRMMEEMK